MVNPVVFATHLSRVLDLFRDPARKEDQKREFRALVGLLKFEGVGLKVRNGLLEINGQAVTSPDFHPLVHRLEAHGVNEMTVPQDAPVHELFELLRALSDQPGGTGDVASRLHASGAYRVSVMLAKLTEGEAPSPSASAVLPPPVAERMPEAGDNLGTSGVLRGEPLRDIESAKAGTSRDSLEIEHIESAESAAEQALPQIEAATPREESVPELPAEHSTVPEAEPVAGAETAAVSFEPASPPEPAEAGPPASAVVEDAERAREVAPPPILAPPPPPPAPSVPPPEAIMPAPISPVPAPPTEPRPELRPSQPPIAQGGSATFALKEARSKEVSEVLATLERNPTAPNIGDVLAVLNRQVEGALRSGKLEQAVEVAAGVVAVEKQVEDTSLKRQYAIALKRMMTKPLLDALGKLVQGSQHEVDAAAVLQRAGADGVEVLLDLLATSSTIQERRGVYNALMHMKESADQLIHMLGHPQWFVVRNVADLMGELGLESSVPALSKALEHTDERVRKAVALALAKIGSRQAAEPLRRALRDKDPGVRMQAALGVGGRKASALAMPLVVALEEEKDASVEKELILALGRIGSPDAVQALIKIAQPSGKLFGRKPTALRMIAVEALRLSATPAALGTLQGLSNDGDKQVRAAAQQALQDLKAKQG